MAVRKKVTPKKTDSDTPVSAISEKPAAASAAAESAKKKAVPKKTAASRKKKVATKKAPLTAKKKTVGRKTGGSTAPSTSSPANGEKPVISQRQRQQMIGDAAYLISLKRPPWQGSPDTDWVSAETVIDMIFDVKD